MARDYDNNPEDEGDDLSEFARDPFGRTTEEQQALEGFKEESEEQYEGDYEDDSYEEPERDTPYSPAYREDEPEQDEDYSEEPLFEEPLREEPLLEATTSGEPIFEEVRLEETGAQDEDDEQDEFLDDSDEEFAGDDTNSDNNQWNVPRLSATDPETWQDEPGYTDEDDDNNTDYTQRLPMGLLMVAGLAVILLIAGGYGVIQQRAESSEEIRQLRAALATAASNEDIEKALAEVEALRVENSDLENRVYDLQIEKRTLADMVAGLEAQVEVANNASSKAATAKPKAQPQKQPAKTPAKPVPAKAPAAQTPPSPGGWFVNFGSYGQQAVAESWKGKLDPASGSVITAPSERDGKTFYRVRIVNLPDKDTANAVARALEEQYGLSRLWVGQQ